MRSWLRWRTRRTLYDNLTKLAKIISDLQFELGPLPANWCTDAMIEIEQLVAVQNFHENARPVADQYDKDLGKWTKNMFRIKEEFVKKGKGWIRQIKGKNKLTKTIEEKIRQTKLNDMSSLETSDSLNSL